MDGRRERLAEARAATRDASLGLRTIEPTRGWRGLDLRQVWQFRELIYVLAWRDVKVRYKQTAVGVLWALLQPLLAMAIFAIFFGRLVLVPSDNLPYPLFAYIGLVPWTYFASATIGASTSLASNRNLISKVSFPRLVIPLAVILAGLVDLGIALVLLAVLLVAFGVGPGVGLALMPLFIVLLVVTTLGVGTLLCALDVHYRDVRYAMPFLVQVWMFATPVVYPASLVPESVRWLYGLNPMAGVVEGLRWSLAGRTEFPGELLWVSTVAAVLLLASGLLYFRRMERTFADAI